MKYILCLVLAFFPAHSRDASDIDALDHLSIQHSILAFKTYDQQEEITLPNNISLPILLIKQWNNISHTISQGWKFFPLEGATGFQDFDILSPCIMGNVGYNAQQNLIVISYRGSQQSSDWVNNFNMGRRHLENANTKFLLHAGYVHCFENSKISLTQSLQKILGDLTPQERDDLTVICTGYSLGGATATIAAYYLVDKNIFKNVQLRIFGPPPVGSYFFSHWMAERLTVAKTFYRKPDILPPYSPSCIGCDTIGKQITLPFRDGLDFLHPYAHSNNRYHEDICQALNIPFEPLYSLRITSVITGGSLEL